MSTKVTAYLQVFKEVGVKFYDLFLWTEWMSSKKMYLFRYNFAVGLFWNLQCCQSGSSSLGIFWNLQYFLLVLRIQDKLENIKTIVICKFFEKTWNKVQDDHSLSMSTICNVSAKVCHSSG